MNKKETKDTIEQLPIALKLLLKAELSAGNEITEIGHSFPAPPIGAYIKLAKPISTRPDDAKDELNFRERNSSLYSREYTDANMRFFILTPPKSQAEATQKKESVKPIVTISENPSQTTNSTPSNSTSPLQRFEESMQINYEKWHDGIGYDLESLKLASQTERRTIEKILINHSPRDWRDIEALTQIDSVSAREVIKSAMKDSDPDVRIAVTRFAPNLVTNIQRSQSLIDALQTAVIFGGLSQTLDDIEDYHPREIKEALIKGLLSREGEVAVLFAGMLFYIYGKAEEPFDMKQRPFFLRFNTENKAERLEAFIELCQKLNIKPEKYLRQKEKIKKKSPL